MKKEALFWRVLEDQTIQCQLCPKACVLKPGEVGDCKVRKNIDGRLISTSYARPCSLNLDPIEKKPLYHFLPGEKALSIATPGCNLHCKFCQNADISQNGTKKVRTLEIKPSEIVKETNIKDARIISYTYTEPTIFYEYVLEIAKIAKEKEIKNTMVSNGFINKKPLKQLAKYLDGCNIDLKGITEDFYRNVCEGRLEPVLESIKTLKEEGVWIEITNLLIPGLNDSRKDIINLVKWVKANLGKDVPLHFTGFAPTYKMLDLPPTPKNKLDEAKKIADLKGMKYVYSGSSNDGNNTYCPKCNKLLIKRKFFDVVENNLEDGKCPECGEEIPGVWS